VTAKRAAPPATPSPKAARAASPRDEGVLHNRKRRGGTLRGKALKRQADVVLERLLAEYPDAHCELDFRSPLELLVATILSAQCTDKRVNLVTPALFAAYPTVEDLAAAPVEEVETLVRSTGFFRSKAKNIVAMAQAVVAEHDGAIPPDMEQLVQLPGVGRKTANVILGNAFGINAGVTVDTHVGRLAIRLGLTRETDPVKVEQALMPLFPREQWAMLSHLLIFHGRRVCEARRPRCEACVLDDVCPSSKVDGVAGGPVPASGGR
jgi:endonuclease-3